MGVARSIVAAGAVLALSAAAIGGCREEKAPVPTSSTSTADRTPMAGDQAASQAVYVDPKIAATFAKLPRQRIIVHLAPTADDTSPLRTESSPDKARVKRRQASLKRRKSRLLADLATAGRSATVAYHYEPFAMLALDVDVDDVRWLSQRSDITKLHADGEERMDTDTSIPFTQVNAPTAAGGDGAGTAIAILDTAVRYWTGEFGNCPAEGAWQDDTPGCRIAVWDNFNTFPNAPDDDPLNDPHQIATTEAHGRNVAGIASAVAPEAKIIALNVFRWNDSLQDYRARRSDVIAALAALPTYQASHGLVVGNLSLGSTWADSRPCSDSDYFDPVRSLWVDYGLLATASAGNGANAQWVSSPGCEIPFVTVGAQHDAGELDDYDGSCQLVGPKAGEVACFSNLNGMLDTIAPGVRIDAAGVIRSGTSMSAPHVAGAIATLQSQTLTDPATLTLRMMAMSQTRHHNGLPYPQLDLAPAPSIKSIAEFPRFYREGPTQLIPAPPYSFSIQATLSEAITAGALLHLELVHAYPDELELVLRAPSGTSLPLSLPAGNANFNKLIGQHHLPGGLSSFIGEGPGTWTLELTDPGGGLRGHYISATLIAIDDTCTPNCTAGSCGPDGCGGNCGDCNQGSFCDAQPDGGTCLACTPDCSNVVCGSDRCGGSCGYCDDGLFCNGAESCDEGACVNGADPCDEPDELPCTDTCSESKKRCNAPAAGFCVIDDQCVAEGDPDPNDQCMVCDPAQNDSVYSPGIGTVCDDGDPCTVDDTCQGGVCAGVAKDCSTNDICLVGSCSPATGSCLTTSVADNTPCDDSDLCTTTSCQAGACTVTALVTCPPPGECRKLTGPCDPNSGTCPDGPADDGTPCDNGTCVAGVCEPVEVPGGIGASSSDDEDDGCGCHIPGRNASTPIAYLLTLAAGIVFRRRRRATRKRF